MSSDSFEAQASGENGVRLPAAIVRSLVLYLAMTALVQLIGLSSFLTGYPRPEVPEGSPIHQKSMGTGVAIATGVLTVIEIALAIGLAWRARWAWHAAFGFPAAFFLFAGIIAAPHLYGSSGWAAIVPLLALAGMATWMTIRWRKALHQAKELFP